MSLEEQVEEPEELKQAKAAQGARKMLKFVVDHREELKSLPADLRERADQILYGSNPHPPS